MPSLYGINNVLLEDLNLKVTSWARCTIVEAGSGERYLRHPPCSHELQESFQSLKKLHLCWTLLVYYEFISTVNLVMAISPLCFGCQEAQSPKSEFSNSKYKAANSLLRRTPWKLEGSEAPGWDLDLKKKEMKRWVRCLGSEAGSHWGEGWRREKGGETEEWHGEGTTGESAPLRNPP